MHRGYIKFWRKAFDSGMHRNHKLWAAWTWILAHAAYRPQRVYCGGGRVELRPGQLLAARSRLAREWNMSERSVRTVLAALASDGCLTIRPTSRYSLLTVNNWELYQSGESPATSRRSGQRPEADAPSAAFKEREEGGKENIETAAPEARDGGTVYRTSAGKTLAGPALAAFEVFWEAFAYKRGKAEAAGAWLTLWPLSDDELASVLAAARREAEARPALLARGRTPKMAHGWLAGRRFEDEDGPRPAPSVPSVSGCPGADDPERPHAPDPFLVSLAEARRRAVAMPERLRTRAREEGEQEHCASYPPPGADQASQAGGAS